MADPADPPAGLDWTAAHARLDAIAARIAGGMSEQERAAELARRAQALAAADTGGPRERTSEIIVFGLAGRKYALEVSRAAAVIPLPAMLPLPGTGPTHLGLAAHRGALFTLVDLNALLERAAAPAAPAFAVLLDDPEFGIGLAADSVMGVSAVKESLLEAAAGGTSLIASILEDDVAVLSPDALIRNAALIVDHRSRAPLGGQDRA